MVVVLCLGPSGIRQHRASLCIAASSQRYQLPHPFQAKRGAACGHMAYKLPKNLATPPIREAACMSSLKIGHQTLESVASG